VLAHVSPSGPRAQPFKPGRPRKIAAERAQLVPLAQDKLAELGPEDKRAEAWYLSVTGRTQLEIAAHFGVAPGTIQRWLKQAALERRQRAENVDEEAERIIGTIEAVATEAWKRHEASDVDGLSGPNYLRLVLDSMKEIARLRGIDQAISTGGSAGTTTLRVRIGGRDISGTPVIDVGVQTT